MYSSLLTFSFFQQKKKIVNLDRILTAQKTANFAISTFHIIDICDPLFIVEVEKLVFKLIIPNCTKL